MISETCFDTVWKGYIPGCLLRTYTKLTGKYLQEYIVGRRVQFVDRMIVTCEANCLGSIPELAISYDE